MKKIILLIIFSFLLVFGSCSLMNFDKFLNDAKEQLVLEQTIVTHDFELPIEITSSFIPFQVEWRSNDEVITIEENPTSVIAKVDYLHNTEKDIEVILTATISFLDRMAEKEFELIVPKYNLGELKGEKTAFSNRLDLDGPMTEGCLPSVGSPKMLVVPINLDNKNKTDKILTDINLVFKGTNEQTGYESVRSYYEKSSYGKLKLDITVMDEWFTPQFSKSFYENYQDNKNNGDGSTLLLQEVLEYYDSSIDFSQYDSNDDGYIDGIWLVYNCDVNYNTTTSIYWAYVYWDYSEKKYDNKQAYYYAFGGTDFMYPTKEEAGTYDPSGIKVDAHTFIHETGHLLGLDDYYDYDKHLGATGGLHGADMMDGNIGDHGSINKLLLGWIEPIVVIGKGAITMDLESFTETGKCLIVTDRKLDSIYNSYYIVEFYTNTGLNVYDKPIQGYGIKVTKINAEKNIIDGEVELNSGSYQCGFKYDNSDETELFVNLICDASDIKEVGYSLSNAVLFTENEKLENNNIFFKLIVNSCSENGANITIAIE